MRDALRGSTLTVPDGMPVVWAANLLGDHLADRVYGPELMLRYCERCAERGHRVWLYGGRDQGSLVQLALRCFAATRASRSWAATRPPFRPLTDDEETRSPSRSTPPGRTSSGSASACRSRRSGWRACASGSTCRCCAASAPPSTSTPAASRRRPSWMQDRGLEWIYRIAQEPRRLLPRYLYTTRASSSPWGGSTLPSASVAVVRPRPGRPAARPLLR